MAAGLYPDTQSEKETLHHWVRYRHQSSKKKGTKSHVQSPNGSKKATRRAIGSEKNQKMASRTHHGNGRGGNRNVDNYTSALGSNQADRT